MDKQRPLPAGWRWVSLREVTRIASGSTPRTGAEEYWGGDIVWITPSDLGKLNSKEISTSDRRITKIGYESCGTEMVPPGSVVMSSRAPIGHLGIACVPLCTNQGCKSFVPGPSVDSVFLYYCLKQSVPLLEAMGSGATFSEVSKTAVEAFEIPLPPLEEQRRIAAILNEQMAAVKRARAAAEAQFEAAKALPAAYLRAVFSSPEAQKWPIKTLGEVTRVASGSTPRSGTEGYWDGDIVWITPTDLGKLSSKEILTSDRRITKAGYESCGTELVPPGSVVMSSRAPIGHLMMFA